MGAFGRAQEEVAREVRGEPRVKDGELRDLAVHLLALGVERVEELLPVARLAEVRVLLLERRVRLPRVLRLVDSLLHVGLERDERRDVAPCELRAPAPHRLDTLIERAALERAQGHVPEVSDVERLGPVVVDDRDVDTHEVDSGLEGGPPACASGSLG